MKSVLKSGELKLWNYPPQPNFAKRPNRCEYYLKKFIRWDPEKLFNLEISGKLCSCGGKYVRKEMSSFRHVDDIESDCYACSMIYCCRKCNKSVSALDEEGMTSANLVSPEIYLFCPIRIFRKSSWTTRLVNLMCDLVISSGCSMKAFISSIARNRTTEYLRRMACYSFHVEEFKRRLNVFNEEFEADGFGSYFQHCQGFNGTLFVSEKQGNEVLIELVTEQENFLLRCLGGMYKGCIFLETSDCRYHR